MKRIFCFFVLIFVFAFPKPSYALSVRHHLINMGKSLVRVVQAPLEGIFIKGPANIRKTFEYEVGGREKEEDRGQFRYFLFSVWRMPGDELKGVVDGTVEGVDAAGNVVKEFLSIFFSD